VAGLIGGVGELIPSPNPKLDPTGRPLGFWTADEVMQTDIHSQGRGGGVQGERLARPVTAPVDGRVALAALALALLLGLELAPWWARLRGRR
jgi:mxaL protein